MSKIGKASGVPSENIAKEQRLSDTQIEFLYTEGFKYNEYLSSDGAYLYDVTNENGINVNVTVEQRGVIHCHITRASEEDSFASECFLFGEESLSEAFESVYEDLVAFINKNTSVEEES